MTSLLILRPQPGADATATKARAMGLDPVITPLFEIRRADWTPPEPALFDAVLMTSANAARCGGAAIARYRHLPLYAVGSATAAAAAAAGFDTIIAGERDGDALVQLAVEQGSRRLLHLTGRDHIDLRHAEVSIDHQAVYASEAVRSLPDAAGSALRGGAVVLIHSPRAASLFAALVDGAALDRAAITVAGLSAAVCDAAGAGWNAIFAAPAPNDDALLAIAARLCDQGSGLVGGEDGA